ncbi:MAG: VWA domain-containing protein [Epsilonproteobacteria bacterium]|nr:VWA domain-containing protein [Campylobacterota bacterium]
MIEFLNPWAFLLLIFAVLFFYKDKRLNINPKLIINYKSMKYKNLFLFISYVCFVVAFARPVNHKKQISIQADKIAIALDLSNSMLANDIYPNRLAFAKKKIKSFISDSNAQIALMGFSNVSFLISAYTFDKDTLKYLIDNLSTKELLTKGTSIQNLINTAKTLGYKNLLVVTDGSHEEHLDTKGVNLYLWLVGKHKAPIKIGSKFLEKNNHIVLVGVNHKLDKYAKLSVVATTDNSDIKQLLQLHFNSTSKATLYNELYIYPLAIGVVFLFASFFSLPSVALVILIGHNAHAGMLDWYLAYQAKHAYLNHDYNKSLDIYSHLHSQKAIYNQANSLYKLHKYKQALRLYSLIKDKSLIQQATYNSGNCYAKLHQINKAIASYKQALRYDPHDKDAKYNLELLLHRKNHRTNHPSTRNSKSKHPSSNPKTTVKLKEINFDLKAKTLMIPISKGQSTNEW